MATTSSILTTTLADGITTTTGIVVEGHGFASTAGSTSSAASASLATGTGNPVIDDHSGLSTGTKASIVIGVGIEALAIILGFVFALRNRNRQKANSS